MVFVFVFFFLGWIKSRYDASQRIMSQRYKNLGALQSHYEKSFRYIRDHFDDNPNGSSISLQEFVKLNGYNKRLCFDLLNNDCLPDLFKYNHVFFHDFITNRVGLTYPYMVSFPDSLFD